MKLSRSASALACALLASAPLSAHAQSLSEAMASALETNPTIEARRARLEATREALPQARSEALPQLSISAGATSSNSDSGVSGASTSDDRSDTWNSSVNATQLLFGSGRVFASTRVARAQIAGATSDYNQAVQDLLLQVTSAYARLREARATVDARQRQADNLEEQRKFAQARFEAGAATRTDLAQAEARLAQARTQLIQSQGVLSAANETYLRLVGTPPGELAGAPAVEGLPATLEEALATAVKQSPLLESARASELAADANVALARSGRGPSLSLQANAGLANEFDSDFDDTSSDSVGVRLSLPLFSGGLTSSRVRQQKSLRQAAGLDRLAAERQVRENVTTAWSNVLTARAAYVSAQEQVQAAELAYRGVRLEQDVGLRATVEALDQENDLLVARLALAAAERDVAINERSLAAAVGALTSPR